MHACMPRCLQACQHTGDKAVQDSWPEHGNVCKPFWVPAHHTRTLQAHSTPILLLVLLMLAMLLLRQ